MKIFNILKNISKNLKDIQNKLINGFEMDLDAGVTGSNDTWYIEGSDGDLTIGNNTGNIILKNLKTPYTLHSLGDDNISLRKIGNIVELRMFGITYTNLKNYTFPSNCYPVKSISVPVVITLSGNCYTGYFTLSSSGNVSCFYFSPGNTNLTPTDSAAVYTTCCYFTD